jgi:hypothetical protein
VLRFLPRQELFSASVSCFRRSGFRVPPSLFVSGLTVGVEPPRFSGSIVLQVVALVCTNFGQVEAGLVLSRWIKDLKSYEFSYFFHGGLSVMCIKCLMKYE